MLFSNKNIMKNKTQYWKLASRRRTLLIRSLTFIFNSFSTAVLLFFLFMYHFPVYFIIPFAACSFLLGFIASSYFIAMWFGLYASLRGPKKDPYDPSHNQKDLDDNTLVALVFPIYHEDVRRIGAALGAMIEDLRQYKEYKNFEYVILSDSRDENIIYQENYIFHLLKEDYPDARIIYRHRISNIDAKIGNTSDFIMRWGERYKFMVMLDADSLVPGETLSQMARIIEGNDKIGIIQTTYYGIMTRTLYARLQSFGSVFGVLVSFYGQYYFRMGRGQYFGHNAILRVETFKKFAALPRFEARAPFPAGRPLSHDFVEAAFFEGAGYEVWLLPYLESFEDQLTNLVDDMKRETRWMYGALFWLRVFRMKRLSNEGMKHLFISSLHYFNAWIGIVFYVCSILGMIYVLKHPIHSYMLREKFSLLFDTSLFLFFFAFFARFSVYLLYFYKKNQLSGFGGFSKLLVSYILSIIFGMAIAPITMMQISKFLFYWIKGRKIQWGEQNREDRSLSFREVFEHFFSVSLFGLSLTYIVLTYILPLATPHTMKILHMSKVWLWVWYIPALSGLVFAPFIIRTTSQRFPWMEKMGWFSTPFETNEPFVVKRTRVIKERYDSIVPESLKFEESLSNSWFFFRHYASITSRPQKFFFWKDKLSQRPFAQLTRQEKLLIFRCRELWEYFFLKKNKLLTSDTETF
ncbi:hypothetical protein BG621_06935 [Parasaccharibacter apium]|nr:hypothetical protein BG621_06935 [Parasaccharibacter apium]